MALFFVYDRTDSDDKTDGPGGAVKRGAVGDVMALAGIGLALVGLWLLAPPLLLVGVGAVLIAVAVLVVR